MKTIYSLLLAVMLSSCAGGLNIRSLPASFTVKNVDKGEATKLVKATYDALERLYGCETFAEEYSKQFNVLFTKVMVEGFTIERVSYDQLEAVRIQLSAQNGITAYSIKEQKFIALPPSQINDGYGRLVRSIAHELLHLADIPNHGNPTKRTDKMMVLMEQCGFESYF